MAIYDIFGTGNQGSSKMVLVSFGVLTVSWKEVSG